MISYIVSNFLFPFQQTCMHVTCMNVYMYMYLGMYMGDCIIMYLCVHECMYLCAFLHLGGHA